MIGPESLTAYVANWGIILPIMLLIIFGGLGFTVLRESAQFMRNKAKRPLWFRIRHLSLHAKFALLMTALLIVLGTVLFAVLEWNNPDTLGGLLWHQKLGGALFQSVTLRTAGFNTISQAGLTDISKFISGIFMIIGGSSGGTAGGIKVVTLGVVLAAIISAVRGKPKVEAFGRTLPMDILQKALTVLVTMLLVVFLSTFILHFTEQSSPFQHGFLDLFFEVASAAGTVGVTTGITPYLSSAGKVVIIICMFLGRLSPLTVVVSLNTRLSATPDSISYPDERVIIG